MTGESTEFKRRLNVWAALSDLFLDTELTDKDYEFIAGKVLKDKKGTGYFMIKKGRKAACPL